MEMETRSPCEVACTLPPLEMRKRRAEVLDAIKGHVQEQKELPDGYALRFDGDAQRLEDVVRLIGLERACCSFLRFRLSVEPQNGPLWLELTGPPGTKQFIRAEMGLAD